MTHLFFNRTIIIAKMAKQNILQDYEENYVTGWVKVFRSFINWEWFDDSKMVHLFLYLILKANHTDNSWRGIEIKKGSFITSIDTIKNDTKLSSKVIRLRLNKLKLSGEIDVKTTNKNTLITILKYSVYQQFENKRANKGQTKGKQRATNNNENNDKENINIPTPKEFKDYALEKGRDINLERLGLKYEAWKQNGWKDGNDKKIKNWKSKLLQTLPYLKNDKQVRL